MENQDISNLLQAIKKHIHDAIEKGHMTKKELKKLLHLLDNLELFIKNN